jgi:aminoglycoside 3'-phosphotransferase II
MKPDLPDSLKSRLEGFSFLEIKLGHSGARVFKLEKVGSEPLILKFAPSSGSVVSGAFIRDDASRLAWANTKNLPVAKLETFLEHDGVEYLLMTEISDREASQAWQPDQIPTVVENMARSLRQWHETPAEDCPFRFPLADQIKENRDRHAGNPVRLLELEAFLARKPQSEDLVLCQGDPCGPNVFLNDDLEITGWIDLGSLGIVDRHCDLSLAVISLEREINRQFNGWSEHFLEAYGSEVINREHLEFWVQFDRFFWGD